MEGISNRHTRWFLSLLPTRIQALLRVLFFIKNSGVVRGVSASSYLPKISWAQEGEDLLLVEELPDLGRYVDIGAHDPFRLSNTKLLYDKGWRGVNIDITSDFLDRFAKYRPEDSNVRALVGHAAVRTLYRFDEEALNTLSEDRAEMLQDKGWRLRSKETVDVRPLTEILTECEAPQHIDLLSVDAEDSDLEILESLDWDYWHVKWVLVEDRAAAYRVPENPIRVFLEGNGFTLSRVWLRSSLFERNSELVPNR